MMNIRRILYRIIKYTLFFLVFLFLVWFVLALTNRIKTFRVCVELPNGLIIGRLALLDPRKPYWSPNVTVKLTDGTTLIKDDVHSIFFSQSTTYGVAGPGNNPLKYYRFAFRPDTGFVLDINDMETYNRLKKEAGELIPFYGRFGRIDQINLLAAYYRLIKHPAYRRQNCRLNIFP